MGQEGLEATSVEVGQEGQEATSVEVGQEGQEGLEATSVEVGQEGLEGQEATSVEVGQEVDAVANKATVINTEVKKKRIILMFYRVSNCLGYRTRRDTWLEMQGRTLICH